MSFAMRSPRVHRVVESLASERSLLVAFSICLTVCMGVLLYLRSRALESPHAAGLDAFEALKSFERRYIALSLGCFVTTAAILLTAVGLRLKLRKASLEPAAAEASRGRTLWLVAISGLSTLIFVVDVQVPLETAI